MKKEWGNKGNPIANKANAMQQQQTRWGVKGSNHTASSSSKQQQQQQLS